MNRHDFNHVKLALQVRAHAYAQAQRELMEPFERAIYRQVRAFARLDAVTQTYQVEGSLEDGATTSESIQTTPASSAITPPRAIPPGTSTQFDRHRRVTMCLILKTCPCTP